MDVINEIILQVAGSAWLYPVMFAVALIDGFFPPIPSETVLVAAAAVAGSSGDPGIVLLAVVAAAGAMIGDSIAYAIGRLVGPARWAWMRGPRAAAAVERAAASLDRRGAPLILGARYIPVGRVAVNMTAGALRYPWRRFLPLSALACTTWAAYSAGIGALAGHWFSDAPLLSALVGVAFALLVGLVVDRVVSARAAHRRGGTDEVRTARGRVDVAG